MSEKWVDEAVERIRESFRYMDLTTSAALVVRRELLAASRRAPAAEGRDVEEVTLRHVAEALLLFHSGSPWDEGKRERWSELTGVEEATTRVLCDLARAALATPPPAERAAVCPTCGHECGYGSAFDRCRVPGCECERTHRTMPSPGELSRTAAPERAQPAAQIGECPDPDAHGPCDVNDLRAALAVAQAELAAALADRRAGVDVDGLIRGARLCCRCPAYAPITEHRPECEARASAGAIRAYFDRLAQDGAAAGTKGVA